MLPCGQYFWFWFKNDPTRTLAQFIFSPRGAYSRGLLKKTFNTKTFILMTLWAPQARGFNGGDLICVTMWSILLILVIRPSNEDPRTFSPRGATRRDVTRGLQLRRELALKLLNLDLT